jgi:hypothetical protein
LSFLENYAKTLHKDIGIELLSFLCYPHVIGVICPALKIGTFLPLALSNGPKNSGNSHFEIMNLNFLEVTHRKKL